MLMPGLVVRHTVEPLREGQARHVRLLYIAVSMALAVYYFAVYLHQPQFCVKPGTLG